MTEQHSANQGAPQHPQPQVVPAQTPYQATYNAGRAAPYGAESVSGSTAPYASGQVQGTTNPYAAPSGSQPAPHGPVHSAGDKGGKDSRGGKPLAKTFLVSFAGALVACALAFGIAAVSGAFSGGSSTTIGSTTSEDVSAISEDPTLAEAVSAKCLPSVAAIDVYTSQASGYQGIYGYGTGSQSGSGDSLVQSSLGSGVVLSADGYVITNYHVVEGGSAYKVTISGETYDAELVGSDPSSDIAVLKAKNASGLTPIELGDSDNLVIGEWVMSIGSPFGLEQSVATGIVSATSRSQIMDSSTDSYGRSTGDYTIYPNMIQTDAAINPGNSGGALVDENGKLIGINTLITSYSGNYSGVGFAIPVNYAVNIAQQIIDGKTPTHAQLGVSLTTINAQMAKRYGLSVDSGAYVAAVTAGGGAESAGVDAGDIITAFDGESVASASDLMLDVRTKNPGDKVTLTIVRDGKTQDIEVTLGSDEQSSAVTQQNSSTLLDSLLGGSSGSSGLGSAA